MEEELLPKTRQGRLDRLQEECAEVIQAVCKGRRFGFEPTEHKGIKYDNYLDLLEELKDLEHAISAVRLMDITKLETQ